MKTTMDGVDVSLWTKVDGLGESSDLGAALDTLTAIFKDNDSASVPFAPVEHMDFEVYDEDNVTLKFKGYIGRKTLRTPNTKRRWTLELRSYAGRALQSATGSLDRSLIVSTDRDHAIAMFVDALKNQTLNNGVTFTDPIIVANEAAGWPYVRATAFLAGREWSYGNLMTRMNGLTSLVPGTYWRLRPDLLLEYGPNDGAGLAPFALSSDKSAVSTIDAAGATLVAFEDFEETVSILDHRNKMRRGGFGAAETIAIDAVSYAKYRRLLDDPYRDDPAIPASDIERATYAELFSRRPYVTTSVKIHTRGLVAGQVVDIKNEAAGSGTIPAPFIDNFSPVFGSSRSGMLSGSKRFSITKVKATPVGPSDHEYVVQLGDNKRDLPTALAGIIA